jgi:cell division septation protein DedD
MKSSLANQEVNSMPIQYDAMGAQVSAPPAYNPAFFQPHPQASAPAEVIPISSQPMPAKKESIKTNNEMFATGVNYAIMGVAMATFAKLYELKSCFNWFLVGSFLISVYRAFATPSATKKLDEIKQQCTLN